MKNRKLPFGYLYENGTICVNKAEAEILHRIFESYIGGMSLLKISEQLNKEKVEYIPGVIGWNKARLMRIIEEKRYLGDDCYPALITADMHSALQKIKYNRNTQKTTDRSADIFSIRLSVRCPHCESEMRRFHDARCKITERWMCKSSTCKTVISISDQTLSEEITKVLTEIVRNPEVITVPENKGTPEMCDEMKRLRSEIVGALNTTAFSKDSLQKKMMAYTSLKYEKLDSSVYISKMLKADLEKSGAPSAELCRKTIKSVYLKTDGTRWSLP